MEVGRQIVHKLSDEVAWMGLYHLVAPSLVPDRGSGLPATKVEASLLDFIHEWDLKS